MPIVDIQRRFRELGRIRAGAVETPPGKRARPVKLARFRLTSPWQHLIEQAATVFGGQARAWDNPGTKGHEWEVFVEVDSLPVVVPPGEVFDQWYEQWTGGGCARRCDGARQVLVDRPCACPADPLERQELAAKGNACKPTTRVRLMLPDVADVGIWRLESHGFHAAAELGGAAGLVEAATRQGAMIPADLRLAAREGARRPGEQRRKFYVPALSFRGTLGPVLDALGILDPDSSMPALLGQVQPRPALDAGGQAELPASGTPFDPAPTEASSFPGPPTEPPAQPAPPPEDPGPGQVEEPSGFTPAAPDEADPGPGQVEPEPFEPPPPAPEDEREGDGPSLTGPQIIAVRLKGVGITDRDEKLRAVALAVGRPELSSSKDLTPREVRDVLSILDDPKERQDFLKWHRETEEARSKPAEPDESPPQEPEEAPPAPEAPAIVPEVLDGPPRRPRGPAPVDDPEGWDLERWRGFMAEHGVKPVALIREASRLARAQGVDAPGNLEAIAGSGLAVELAGFVLAEGGS